MNKYTLLIVFLCTLSACATTPFPPQDIVVSTPTSHGRIFVIIEKGKLGEEYKGKWWVTKEEFIKAKSPKSLEEDI